MLFSHLGNINGILKEIQLDAEIDLQNDEKAKEIIYDLAKNREFVLELQEKIDIYIKKNK